MRLISSLAPYPIYNNFFTFLIKYMFGNFGNPIKSSTFVPFLESTVYGRWLFY